jgi:hypothetical protein
MKPVDSTGIDYKAGVLKAEPEACADLCNDAWPKDERGWAVFRNKNTPKQMGRGKTEEAAWRDAYENLPVAPSSVAPESREPTEEERDEFCIAAVEQAKINHPATSWGRRKIHIDPFLGIIDKYSGAVADFAIRKIRSLESENVTLRNELFTLKAQVLPQLKRDDQTFENWKKVSGQ